MVEYTYKDIIIDPTSEEAKNAVGEGCYFGSNPKTVLDFANCNEKKFLRVLECIKPEEDNPFYDYKYGFPCIIVKKEEPKKYVPFETLDEFIESYKKVEEQINYSKAEDYIASCGMWLRFNNDDVLCAVTEIWTDGVFLGHDHMKIKWEELFNFYTFMDDSPCGKLMEVKDL